MQKSQPSLPVVPAHPCLAVAAGLPEGVARGYLLALPECVSLETPVSIVCLSKFSTRLKASWGVAKELRNELRRPATTGLKYCALWIRKSVDGLTADMLMVERNPRFPGGVAFHRYRGRLLKNGWKWKHDYLDGKRKASGGQMEIPETGVILAIDLGTTAGYARSACDRSYIAVSGIIRLSGCASEHKGMRFIRFRHWLETGLEGVSQVFYEEIKMHQGTEAAHIYGGLKAILLMACAERNLPIHGVGAQEVKKLFTGTGAAKKQAMIDEAVRRGFSPVDDNEADAIGILHFGIPTLMVSGPELNHLDMFQQHAVQPNLNLPVGETSLALADHT